MNILADALTPCALFAIGLGLSLEGLRSNLSASLGLAAIPRRPKATHSLSMIVAVICAPVPTAKTMYILASEHNVEEPLVAATVSITTMLSVATLLGWVYALSRLAERAS